MPPIGSCEKTSGIVTKTRPGPALGSWPSAKTAGMIINPAAYTHTSVALLDAVKAVGIPTVEVHVSDPDRREDFRHVSYIRAACIATIRGHGLPGYLEALHLLCERGEGRG